MIGTTIQRILLATILLFSLTTGLQAQDDLLGTEDTPPPNPGQEVPVDGGLSLMLAAGVAYGLKRCRKGKRND